MSLLRILTPAFCIVLAPWLVADQLPRFEPQPLLIEVNDPQAKPPIKGQYLIVGQAALEAPIRIEPGAITRTSFTNPAELFDFIQYYASRVKTLENVEDLLEFSYVKDPARLSERFSDPKVRERLMEIYHGLNDMEYIFGWFESSETFCALLRISTGNNPKPYIAPVFFIFHDGEWKVQTAFKASGQIIDDMTWAVWRGDYEEKLKLNPIPDALRAAHQEQLDSRSVVRVEPVLIQTTPEKTKN